MPIPYQGRRASGVMLAQELPLSCGAACARELLRQMNIHLPESAIRAQASYRSGGNGVLGGILAAPLGQALTVLSRESWSGGVPDVDFEQIPGHLVANSPLIAMLNRHWVIVESYNGGALKILDPEPCPPGGQFATEGTLPYPTFLGLFQRGGFQVVERT